MAVEDALALADSLSKAGLNGTAFEQFEHLRRKKVDWTVATSWSIGRICHLDNPVARGLRNAALKHTPKRVADKQFQRLYSLEM
jgi:2-polyprenyl-6-methoxyphenol hydroxylase-like FAD-dependent oxidoreductase